MIHFPAMSKSSSAEKITGSDNAHIMVTQSIMLSWMSLNELPQAMILLPTVPKSSSADKS
jgi:hypothetical protein